MSDREKQIIETLRAYLLGVYNLEDVVTNILLLFTTEELT